MSSGNITITWEVSSSFNTDELERILSGYAIETLELKTEYEKGSWKVNGLTIKLYERSLAVQGRHTTSGVKIVSDIKSLKGLSLDQKNRARLAALTPVFQNAIECEKCGEHSYLIQSKTQGLEITFKNECGHNNNVKSPFLMCVNRILPDLNVLKSRNLSRMIDLGYFEGCEIVIPSYVMKCLDKYLGGSKNTISDEIQELRELEKKGLISLYSYEDNMPIPDSREKFDVEENNTLLEIATITNSIFITSDINCKDQALLHRRPVIFLDHETTKNTKILHELRTPSL
jgi:hypothetical protein